MMLRTLHNKVQLSQCADLMRQLRPTIKSSDISNLASWRYKFITASSNDKVVAVGAYFPTASLLRGIFNYLADLVVDKEHRSKGIGAEMLAEILKSYPVCELDSGLERKDAHRFYESHGFAHSKYAVRLEAISLEAINDLPFQDTQLIPNNNRFQKQNINFQNHIQEFINKNSAVSATYQVNLQLFMIENPGHQLLLLRNSGNGELDGVLLFELQKRLSIGGNCFYVSDLIVKNSPSKTEKQNALLLALIRHAKDCNSMINDVSVKNVIIEMTDDEIKNHELSCHATVSNKSKVSVNDGGIKKNINTFFSVTAKHFSKSFFDHSNSSPHLISWHQKL